MLGGMVWLCSLAMCLRTISEYRKRSPQMRQCHWSRAKMYGRHSVLFGSSLGSGILINPVDAARSRRLRYETQSFFEALAPSAANFTIAAREAACSASLIQHSGIVNDTH